MFCIIIRYTVNSDSNKMLLDLEAYSLELSHKHTYIFICIYIPHNNTAIFIIIFLLSASSNLFSGYCFFISRTLSTFVSFPYESFPVFVLFYTFFMAQFFFLLHAMIWYSTSLCINISIECNSYRINPHTNNI